jgi:hypothetical protein
MICGSGMKRSNKRNSICHGKDPMKKFTLIIFSNSKVFARIIWEQQMLINKKLLNFPKL